jgi:hypothetical protein
MLSNFLHHGSSVDDNGKFDLALRRKLQYQGGVTGLAIAAKETRRTLNRNSLI